MGLVEYTKQFASVFAGFLKGNQYDSKQMAKDLIKGGIKEKLKNARQVNNTGVWGRK